MPSYNSLPVEYNSRAQATNRVFVTAPMKEGIAKQTGGTRPMVISKLEPPSLAPCSDAIGLSLEPDCERNFIVGRSDHHRNAMVIAEVVGRTDGKQSPRDGLTGTTPLSYLDDVAGQHVVPVENWAKEDVVVNKPDNKDIPLVGGTSVETSECMIKESPTEYGTAVASTMSKADTVENWIAPDFVKPTDGRMDTLKLGNPEFFVNNDTFAYNTQHAIEKKGVVLDSNLGRSKLIADGNQVKMMDVLPSSTIEISFHMETIPSRWNIMRLHIHLFGAFLDQILN